MLGVLHRPPDADRDLMDELVLGPHRGQAPMARPQARPIFPPVGGRGSHECLPITNRGSSSPFMGATSIRCMWRVSYSGGGDGMSGSFFTKLLFNPPPNPRGGPHPPNQAWQPPPKKNGPSKGIPQKHRWTGKKCRRFAQ